jgi:hypothetical protein
MRDWIPSLRIDVPAEPRAHEVNDQSLIEAIAAKDGAAMIGLKPAGASRTRDNGGIVPGIDKATAMAGRAVIQAMGGEITRTFRNTATVVVKIPPELGPKLREHPLVNFIEPVGTAVLSSSSAASASNAVAINPSFYRFSQDTSWGVFKVNADDAWELENEGGSATISLATPIRTFAHTTTRVSMIVLMGSPIRMDTAVMFLELPTRSTIVTGILVSHPPPGLSSCEYAPQPDNAISMGLHQRSTGSRIEKRHAGL